MIKKHGKHSEENKPENDFGVEGDQAAGEKKQNDLSELEDKYLRLQAEFDNYKKRTFREKTEFIKFANEGLIIELLGILDNFERGVKAADLTKDFSLLHKGVDMISKQLHALLETKGLKRIITIGETFDPHQHEAMEVVEDDNLIQDTVVEELQPGYFLNDRIVRPAKVKVAKGKIEEPKSEKVEEAKNEDQENNKQEEEIG
ncbi:MAG: nucleotide exchange factor GrpE [Candidatus Omnitrophica bacterium]|nr:nucleotide exchange factor GrpE [Candidatus Omnitrophota bacterium]MBU2045037.1 nucleotide exchange factor GrpE [Candidatus Omnitrophota bacterium]MBU2251428.1 nucleotide exchange factor GrpE [Candidatus Omnitrophota bacterium]MBU2265951.1 nucleotide exchange factor GrpE [Candidatus Omnitrophota bacterium]MBU2474267.1 nucleotide exchange factor GrpE [Candidatus Omnitrophota bacterium]